MKSTLGYRALALGAIFTTGIGIALPRRGDAAEVAQGTFEVTLGDNFVCAQGGGPYIAYLNFDNLVYQIPFANSVLTVNFADLGPMGVSGNVDCVFDKGGTFASSGSNNLQDFQWVTMEGEYLDEVPGITEGDPFPFVGTAHCTTTRTDDFKTLCDNFEFSFNGLSRALAPDPWFRYYAGDFTFRVAERVPVDAGATVGVTAMVDGPPGPVPDVAVSFENGVMAPGTLGVTTLAQAHGAIPPGFALPVRGATSLDHGSGPVPFFSGGDERFVELSTDATLPGAPAIEVCLPMPGGNDPAAARPVRVLHGEGTGPADRQFVDRTSRVDAATGKACARVHGFSKFAVVTTDACGGGQAQSDGLITVAGGLIGKHTVVVDGLTDCTQYPASLPRGRARYCVPDADPTPGQCGVALSLGVNRAGCNRSAQASSLVDVGTYTGTITHGGSGPDLTALFGPAIAALSDPVEASVGPTVISLPAQHRITTYTLRQQLTGLRPGASFAETDKDILKIQCIDPAQF